MDETKFFSATRMDIHSSSSSFGKKPVLFWDLKTCQNSIERSRTMFTRDNIDLAI